MTITHVYFDIGGVLGTNAWDKEQRLAAVKAFGLDADDFAERHQAASGSWETGGMSLNEYLRCTIFHRPRGFTPDAFRAFMLAQSVPFPESIAVARALAGAGRWRLMTLNNESAELNTYRLRHFGLTDIFSVFFTSCWLGARKPARRIYELALEMAQADPGSAVFIDDRDRNLDTARALGMLTVQYTGVERLRADLAAVGVAV